MSAVSMILSLYWKFSFVLGGGLAGGPAAQGVAFAHPVM